MLKFKKSVLIKTSIIKLFEFHRNTNNLALITPKYVKIKILSISDLPLVKGSIISLKIKFLIFTNKWIVNISECKPPYLIKDFQIKGLFGFWHHSHLFEETEARTIMTDFVEFKPPLGIIGYLGFPFIYFLLYLMFTYRHKLTKTIFK